MKMPNGNHNEVSIDLPQEYFKLSSQNDNQKPYCKQKQLFL
jgi:hypothetical protein